MAIAYRSSNSATGNASTVVTKPTGTAADDWLLYVVVLLSDVADTYGTLTWPAGFTEIGSVTSQTGDDTKLLVAKKKAGGSEGADYTASWSRSYYMQGAVLAFSGCDLTDCVDVYATNTDTTSDTSIVAPSVTPTVTPTMLVSVYQHGDDNGSGGLFGARITPPGGQTEAIEIIGDAAGGYIETAVAYEAITGTSATGTRTATIGYGAKRSLGFSILLREPQLSATRFIMLKGM